MTSPALLRYPSTRHLPGSGWSSRTNGPSQDAVASPTGRFVVVEEKFDGQEMGLSFNEEGRPFIQSRGAFIATPSAANPLATEALAWVSCHQLVSHPTALATGSIPGAGG